MKAITRTLALLAVLLASPALARAPAPVTVQLLAINDLHGHLEPTTGAEGEVNKVPAGGMEYLATHLRAAARDNPRTLIVGAGDMIGASPLLSGKAHDRPTIEALNALHMAVTSIGNHELDDGAAAFLRTASGARFRYLAANALRTGPRGGTLEPPTAIRTVGGIRIGFIGEVLADTGHMISPTSARGLRFVEESAVANAAAARLRRQGVRAIVLLIHQGGFQHPASGVTDPDGCDHFSGDLVGVVEKLSPAIKLVISGHSHSFYNCEIAGHRVTSAGSFGRGYTAVALTIDPRTDAIVAVKAVNRIVTRDVAKDPAQTAILERYRPAAAKIADRVVGTASADIARTANAAGESAIGDVLADAQVADAGRGGPEIAFLNSGGIRAAIVGPPGSSGPHPVTYGDLYAVQPFADRAMTLTLTGEMIRRLLEQQFRPNGGRFVLQVSRGFTYRYRNDAPPGQHVEPGSIRLNGRPIDPDQAVRVATTDFLYVGGEGFSVFGEGKDPAIGAADVEVLTAYFTAHSPVEPGPQDRIVRIDAEGAKPAPEDD